VTTEHAEPGDEVARAAALLRAGGLVAFPTETVYGLGADASNAGAVGRLFAVKRRPADHPVIVHLAHARQLDAYAVDVAGAARLLAREFWPGPLTLIVRRRPEAIVDAVAGGRATVGIRVPRHPLAHALLDAFGGAVAAPSANRFGKVSPTTAEHVRADLGADVDAVLDGGPCEVGVESTIVDVTRAQPVILRVGAVSERDLSRVLGAPLVRQTEGEVAAPGTLPSHYSPDARVELVAPADLHERARELRAAGRRVEVIEPPAQAEEYAHSLYARLRQADLPGVDTILAVLPDDDGGLATAVRDRLRRAAAG